MEFSSLRAFAQHDVKRIFKSVQAGRRPLYVLPTGGGKSRTMAYVADRFARAGVSSWITMHRRNLVSQFDRTLTTCGVEHGLLAPGGTPSDRVDVVSIDYLRDKEIRFPGAILLDEAHHSEHGNKWGKFLGSLPGSTYVMGATASPIRTNGQPLSGFDELIIGPSPRQLIAWGYMLPAEVYCPPTPIEYAGLEIRHGEYLRSQLQGRIDLVKKILVGNAVEQYTKHCRGVPAIAFCLSRQDAEDVAASFRTAGYVSHFIHGGMPAAEQDRLLWSFEAGFIDVLTSCDLISEGTDLPPAQCAIMLRPTESLAMHLQMLGRVLRPFPGQDCAYVLDLVGNVGRFVDGRFLVKHGFPADDREWTLDGRVKSGRRVSNAAIYLCENPVCFAPYEAAPACPYCGKLAPVRQIETIRTIERVAGELLSAKAAELAERERVAARNSRFVAARKAARTVPDLIRVGREFGVNNPMAWAETVMRARKRW